MPKDSPDQELLDSKKISFFSIDTNIFQSAGFKFDVGALNQLDLQRPDWLTLKLSDVMVREVMEHRMEPVLEAVQEISSASSKLKRVTGLDLEPTNQAIAALNVEASARTRFNQQLASFIERLGGEILPSKGSDLATKMLERYFDQQPPFEAKKKSEFPDAAALLVLEHYARKNQTLGILISQDLGWSNFSNTSDFLYCVKSLEEFTALFASNGPNADAVKKRIRASLSDTNTPFSIQLRAALQHHVANSTWSEGEIYSNSASRVEAEAYDSSLVSYEVDLTTIEVWFDDGDDTECLVEFTANVAAEIAISLNWFVYDSIDREEVSIGSTGIKIPTEIDVPVYFNCSTNDVAGLPAEWIGGFEIADEDYSIDIGEVDPDFGGEDE